MPGPDYYDCETTVRPPGYGHFFVFVFVCVSPPTSERPSNFLFFVLFSFKAKHIFLLGQMTHPSFAGAVNFGQATRTPNVVVVVLCWLFILRFDQLMERFLNVESSRNFFFFSLEIFMEVVELWASVDVVVQLPHDTTYSMCTGRQFFFPLSTSCLLLSPLQS